MTALTATHAGALSGWVLDSDSVSDLSALLDRNKSIVKPCTLPLVAAVVVEAASALFPPPSMANTLATDRRTSSTVAILSVPCMTTAELYGSGGRGRAGNTNRKSFTSSSAVGAPLPLPVPPMLRSSNRIACPPACKASPPTDVRNSEASVHICA